VTTRVGRHDADELQPLDQGEGTCDPTVFRARLEASGGAFLCKEIAEVADVCQSPLQRLERGWALGVVVMCDANEDQHNTTPLVHYSKCDYEVRCCESFATTDRSVPA